MIDSPPILHKSLELARALYPSAFQELRTFHVSVLWNKNKLLSVGVNRRSTHPRNLKNKKFNRKGHDISQMKFRCSEFESFIGLGKQRYTLDFSKCTMVNIRINKENQISLSQPCNSCENLIQWLGLRRVFFTNNEGNFELYKI